MANNLLNRENEAKPLIEKTMALQNEIFTSNPRAKIVEDITVYFPFEWHVKAKPYHPFSGSNPAGIPKNNILWTSIIDTATLNTKKPDIILLGNASINIFKQPKNTSDSVLLNYILKNFIKTYDSQELMLWARR